MKATLAFKLPEESDEHQTALDGWKWRQVVSDLAGHLRDRLKHEDLPEQIGIEIYHIRTQLLRDIEDRGLHLYE